MLKLKYMNEVVHSSQSFFFLPERVTVNPYLHAAHMCMHAHVRVLSLSFFLLVAAFFKSFV